MPLRETIAADMTEAMRAQDRARLQAVRLLRAAIQRREVDEKQSLNDTEVLVVIQRMIKQCNDSIDQFTSGNRNDLVEKEMVMLDVLTKYLPQPLNEEETLNIISEAIMETRAESIRDMGPVMSWLKPKLQGKADMAFVSKAVREKLN
ncbi:MAG: glutamyl-tRNA amidotransferase [Acidiferrobacteraceae bacterium]|nr:glutamyl-tRNA amidotransferase [Acidiferrobacteraceae bacterium]|tara:strand:- start:532 stop:975 length:444 start_codon:yes stop_codon:yes gene_type:complete